MRSYRDYWLWSGGFFLVLAPFTAGIAFAYFAKVARYSLFGNPWMIISLTSFCATFACFFAAIKGYRFPPWAKIKFPDLAVIVNGVGEFAVENELMPGFKVPSRIIAYPVVIKNRESEQDASLTPRLFLKIKPGTLGLAIETVAVEPNFAPQLAYDLRRIPVPIFLKAGDVIGGHLVFELSPCMISLLQEPREAEVEFEDHISGKRVRCKTEVGEHDRSKLVPSQGGIRFYDSLPNETETSAKAEEVPSEPEVEELEEAAAVSNESAAPPASGDNSTQPRAVAPND